MKSKWIVGGGHFLDQAYQAWQQARPDEVVQKIEAPQGADYAFDMQVFEGLNPAEGSMFVAFNERFGNFKRMELMQAAMERGFKLEPFISPHAYVADNAVIGPNVFIDAGVYVGAGTRIDYNTVIHAGARLGSGVHLRASCWVDMGVTIGNQTAVGAHSTLRMGSIVAANTKIGRNCELGWPMRYEKDIAAKTVFDPRYCEPIHVYNQ